MVDGHGQHLFWADDAQARALLKERKARLVRKHGHARILVATDGFAREYGSLEAGRGTAFDKTRYSHNHETRENPEKVWTLKRIARVDRPVFTAVLDDCLAA